MKTQFQRPNRTRPAVTHLALFKLVARCKRVNHFARKAVPRPSRGRPAGICTNNMPITEVGRPALLPNVLLNSGWMTSLPQLV